MSYIKSFLKKKVDDWIPLDEAKQLCRRNIMDTLSWIPQMVYDEFLEFFPVPELNQHLVTKAIFGASKHIPWDRPHLWDILKELPPQRILLKDVSRIYDRIQKEYLKKLEPMVSNQVMHHIQENVMKFLEKRNNAIDLVYLHKDHPEHLLRKLLHWSNILEENDDIETMKDYLASGQAKIYIDQIYGVFWLLLSSEIAHSDTPIAGTFNSDWMTTDEPILSLSEYMESYSDDENEMKPMKSLYRIFIKKGHKASTRIHEKQHFLYSLIESGTLFDRDFWNRGQDEILAYMKMGVSIDDIIRIMHEYYNYYDEEIRHIQKRIDKRNAFIAGCDENDIRAKNAMKNLKQNEKKLLEYQNTYLPLRNEYLSTIDEYIRMAYKFKAADIENRLELLMLTPIRQRPKLLEIYDIKK